MNKLPFTLFSIYYKPFMVPDAPYVHPIQAGRAVNPGFGIEGDDTGDHISHLNQNWVELTAMYYIWKNYSEEKAPYWGLVHYRRYFTLRLDWNPFKRIYYLKANDETFKRVLNTKLEAYIAKQLAEGKIILPKRHHMYKLKKWSVKQQYIRDHDADAWNLMEKAVKTLHPEYSQSFDRFAGGLDICVFNIMVASWDFWDGYISWLFSILNEVKKEYKIREDPNQRRVFGFLSERLLNVYVLHQQKHKGQKIKYMRVAHFS
jgi:hypothetical protein